MTAVARRSALLALTAVVCLAVALTTATQAQSKSSYSGCHLSSKDKSANKHGPSYLTSVKVKGVGCSTAKSFVKSYYKCRTSNHKGKGGRCTSKVSGYSCSEHRSDVIPTSFDAKVTCSKGSKCIVHSYEKLL